MSQCIGVRLPKFQAPLTYRFIGDDNPALGKQFLDITKTKRKAKIEPYRMADDFRWETESLVIGSNGVRFHEAILAQCSATLSS
ncbi:hypothetical protein KSB_91490 [Ktedonobacter robiniae]|uniref:Uncharacterized protein n=1 Tax=Ktedonobacter robiniae TaxID=2778365 RepID=A0ABQ3V640_9CHLR|nr:hypothetical protein KSB_91490 [Ktedonobacter robiniae]